MKLSKLFQKKDFLLKIFSVLILQFCILLGSFYTAEKTNIIPKKLSVMLSLVLLSFGLIICFVFLQNPIYLLICFSLFSIIYGFICSIAYDLKEHKDLLVKSLWTTFAIFVSMFVIGYGLFYLGGSSLISEQVFIYLGIGLFLCILASFFIAIFLRGDTKTQFRRYLSFGIIVLFCFYILFETYFILQRPYQETWADSIRASMDYFLDLINIFSNVYSLSES